MDPMNPMSLPYCGLKYNFEYLESIFPEAILYSQKEQAKLADAVAQQFASDRDFCEKMLPRDIGPETWAQMNATSVGNAAYMALHAHPNYRDAYTAHYTAMQNELKRIHKDIACTRRCVNDAQKIPAPILMLQRALRKAGGSPGDRLCLFGLRICVR